MTTARRKNEFARLKRLFDFVAVSSLRSYAHVSLFILRRLSEPHLYHERLLEREVLRLAALVLGHLALALGARAGLLLGASRRRRLAFPLSDSVVSARHHMRCGATRPRRSP